MPDIMTKEHKWIAISIEPVTVLQDPDSNSVIVFGDPDEPKQTQYGCSDCNEPLTGNYGTECKGGYEA